MAAGGGICGSDANEEHGTCREVAGDGGGQIQDEDKEVADGAVVR